MFGMAVLSRDVLEETLCTIDKPLHPDDHSNIRYTARCMLQGVVTVMLAATRIPEVRHAAIADSSHNEVATKRLLSAWDLLQKRHVG